MTFRSFWGRRWHAWTPNNAEIQPLAAGVRLALTQYDRIVYSDAQLDDYVAGDLRWQAPVRLQLEAQFCGDPEHFVGTAGFGWWNDPAGTGLRRLRLPQALWFFYASTASQLELTANGASNGWLAMSFVPRLAFCLALLPLAPLAIVLSQNSWLRQRCCLPLLQLALGVRSQPIQLKWNAWQHYQIDWYADRVEFWLDQQLVLKTRNLPTSKLGLILWLDNQYAQVSPRGIVRGGVLAHQAQALEIRNLSISELATSAI